MLSRLIIEKIACNPDPHAVAAVFGSLDGAALLESSLPGGKYSRWSVYSADPVATVKVRANMGGCPFDQLAEAFAQFPKTESPSIDFPYCCGWFGYLSYEAGLLAEGVPSVHDDTSSLPLAQFSLYDAVALHDTSSDQWYAVAIDWGQCLSTSRPPASERIGRINEILNEASLGPRPDDPLRPAPRDLTPSFTKAQYLAGVEKILTYIAAGDVYQVNLTQRFRTQTTLTPLDLYRRLREISPSSHSAFLSGDDFAIISSSPELFLHTAEEKIMTRPIKGTRPRSTDAVLDEEFRRELESAEKDTAELAMIVDLMRNDLGRISEFGSIRVTDPASIEQYPTVYHRVATVEGRLRQGTSLAEILRTTYPGGSITGAPKIRAMQIISELETTPRGPYCGAIGWIGLNGALSLNVAIRTMIQRGRSVDLHAGGGIVADSIPQKEYDEMMTKLSAMARALGCDLQELETVEDFVGANP